MHGLVNRALQRFISDTYGQEIWESVAQNAGFEFENFESMLSYEDEVTRAALNAASEQLSKPINAILEDLGIYLVAHPNCEVLRRLLRFGGDTFVEFVGSLSDLPERARLAVPDLDFPAIEVGESGPSEYCVTVSTRHLGTGHALLGVLQAMADDYGALAIIEHCGITADGEKLSVAIHDTTFGEARTFELAPKVSM